MREGKRFEMKGRERELSWNRQDWERKGGRWRERGLTRQGRNRDDLKEEEMSQREKVKGL